MRLILLSILLFSVLAGCAADVDAPEASPPEPSPDAAFAPEPPAGPQWATVDAATIRPGTRILFDPGLPSTDVVTTDTLCTSNFLFTGQDGTVYLGTAGHCFADFSDCTADPSAFPLGSEVRVEGAEHPGVLRYVSFYAMVEQNETSEAACEGNDLALIELHPEDVLNANPAVLGADGPTGVASGAPSLGDMSYTYGQSDLRPGPHEIDGRQGVFFDTSNAGWTLLYYYTIPGVPGDSGSAVLDAEGNARGVFVTLIFTPATGANGVADIVPLLDYAAVWGLPVQVATV